jgi:hypothetical protein
MPPLFPSRRARDIALGGGRRWSDAVDVMIPKKAASTHVEKLRIIVLFHALFNMLNKRVAKKATDTAMDKQVIPSKIAAKR